MDVEVYRMIGEGDLVAVHSHYKSFNIAGVDKQTSPSVTRPITPSSKRTGQLGPGDD